jgi:hypothetical protein
MVPWLERPTLIMDGYAIRRATTPPFPPDVIAAGRALLDEILPMIPKKARLLAYALALRTGNRFGHEFKSAAKWVNADHRDIALANLSYDLVVGLWGCSTIVLPTNEGPVVARNMDWEPEAAMARASYLIRAEHRGEWCFTHAGFPGAVGVVTGLSSRGFAVILNAVMSPDPVAKLGYPVLLHLRRVMEDARTFDHALDMLTHQKLTTSALFTLVGTTNAQRVVVERAPKRHALRWGIPGEALLTTNNYQLLDQHLTPNAVPFGLSQTSCGRFQRLERLTARRSFDDITDHELLFWLTDPQVRQAITAQHVLIRPARNEMRLFVPRALVEDGIMV